MEDQSGQGRRMSRPALFVLGLATFWPPIYIVLFIGVIGLGIAGGGQVMDRIFPVVGVLHVLTMLEMVALTVFYGVNVFQEPALQGDRKILWMVIVLLGGFIGQAFYYVAWLVKRHPAVLGSTLPVAPQYVMSPPGDEAQGE